MMKAILFVAALVTTHAASAAEPRFCDPKTFASLEIAPETQGLSRAHEYKIGNLVLLGVGVGSSNASDLQSEALKHSTSSQAKKFCTWYLNDGNLEAEVKFVYQPLSKPIGTTDVLLKEYSDTLKVDFEDGHQSFASCASENSYIALGCNSMKHRGPTVFAMLLSFAGCTPEHSVTIVNDVWGTNEIPVENRLALAKMAYDLGNKQTSARASLQKSMSSVYK